MGISMGIVDWLCAEGHDAEHLREEGLQRLPDPEIFTKAVREKRIVLAFDLDFGEIAALSRNQKTSVILFRLHNTTTPHVIDRLRVALSRSAKDFEEGAIVIVEEARIRVRRLLI